MRETITTNANVSVSRMIKKAKINKNEFLDIVYEEIVTIIEIIDGKEVPKTITADYSRDGKNIVHPDLKDAFNLLRPHLSFLCDQVECQGKTFYDLDNDEDSLAKYKVNSYSLGGSGEHSGVTLSGYRVGKGGIVNLNTPFTKFEGGEKEEPYEHGYELSGLLNHCNEECLLYLGGKIAPNAQTEMDFDNPDHQEGEEFE